MGDLVWNVKALDTASPKFSITSRIADNDRKQALASIRAVAETHQQIPGLIVVPAHDQAVHEVIGYFPNWIQ